MTSLRTILPPAQIRLTLQAPDLAAATREVLELLRGDLRVLQWEALEKAVHDRAAAPLCAKGCCGILIAHGRTNAVGSLVLSAGRFPAGVEDPATGQRVQLVFVAGIPTAFNNDYLRIVGTIARVCGNPDKNRSLLQATVPSDFIEILASGETELG